MNNFYDPVKNPQNAFLIDFMFITSAYGVNTRTLINSMKTFNSINCVQASFRDRLNEEISKTCCCSNEELRRHVDTMQMHQAQWKMIDDTIQCIHTACDTTREQINTSILQSSKTSFDPDSKVITIKNEPVEYTLYADNEPYATFKFEDPVAKTKETEPCKLDRIENIINAHNNGIISEKEAKNLLKYLDNGDEKELIVNVAKAYCNRYKESYDSISKPNDIYAGDGFIIRALRKLIMTANSIIGWFVDELTRDFL